MSHEQTVIDLVGLTLPLDPSPFDLGASSCSVAFGLRRLVDMAGNRFGCVQFGQ